ncbi:hypothetical protein [Frigoriglobus tundricola]|uniref:Uncharacterized protein n=1 Tax=Frigoriglobus tundricola TaxID=2774151 RepID=A0A6M5YZP9_9BACT|nr:hypothetical protein [Frigoriglobus tundricola]QJW99607.1 hypothetical protein FTUN_7221 [Frigoriglobus tundricola]
MDHLNTHTLEEARAAKSRAQEVFEALVKVVGVGITRVENGYGLKVNLLTPPPADAILPTEVDGVPVRLEVVGQPKKR